jgi:hypothetical protein
MCGVRGRLLEPFVEDTLQGRPGLGRMRDEIGELEMGRVVELPETAGSPEGRYTAFDRYARTGEGNKVRRFPDDHGRAFDFIIETFHHAYDTTKSGYRTARCP